MVIGKYNVQMIDRYKPRKDSPSPHRYPAPIYPPPGYPPCYPPPSYPAPSYTMPGYTALGAWAFGSVGALYVYKKNVFNCEGHSCS